jgi:hypothetical protein
MAEQTGQTRTYVVGKGKDKRTIKVRIVRKRRPKKETKDGTK